MIWRRLALSAALLAAMGVPAALADPLKFRVADVYPVNHTVSNSTIKVFMDEVLKKLGDKATFEYYPAEQLGKGKDLLSLTQTGVVDIGLIVPSYVSDKMPLSAVDELPGSYKSSCQATLAMYELVTRGVLAKAEFGANGLHVLIAHSFAPFQAFSSKPFEGLKSFEGQKLRTLGQVTDMTIKAMGAVPIRIAAPDINQALNRGTIDGGLMGIATAVSYDLTPYLKSATYGESLGGAFVAYAMSESKWKALPADVQQAMTDAGYDATRNGCAFADKSVDDEFEKLRKAGVAIVQFSPEDRATLSKRTADIAKEWSTQLDQRGKPGSEVLDAFEGALKNN
jgi:TRAP-type C4-dicarboxylate transport system substrate-binding protein